MLGRNRHGRASTDAPDDRRRVLFRAAALIPGYIVYRLQGDDRLARGLLMGAGVVLILWGSIDAFFLARRNLSGYFIADRERARTFQYVLIVVGGVMALAGLVVG